MPKQRTEIYHLKKEVMSNTKDGKETVDETGGNSVVDINLKESSYSEV